MQLRIRDVELQQNQIALAWVMKKDWNSRIRAKTL
jgi:hypothetical protein